MRTALQIFGVLFLAQIIFIVAVIGYFGLIHQPEPREVREIANISAVLNSIGIDPEQKFIVINSRQREPAWNGDFSRWACLEFSSNPIANSRKEWVQGVESGPVYTKVRVTAASFGDLTSCFGRPVSSDGKAIAAYIHRVEINHRTDFEGATVAFFDTVSNRVYYIEWQM